MIVYFKRNIYCLLTRITLRYFENDIYIILVLLIFPIHEQRYGYEKKRKKKKNRILHRHVTFHVQFYARRDICLEG